jgi:hypothetical protein
MFGLLMPRIAQAICVYNKYDSVKNRTKETKVKPTCIININNN